MFFPVPIVEIKNLEPRRELVRVEVKKQLKSNWRKIQQLCVVGKEIQEAFCGKPGKQK
jgi:hypothetical protein